MDKKVKVKVIDLSSFRRPGERRIPYDKILLAAEHNNTSKYILPGPSGYLSPSTLVKWHKCPYSVYLSKITKTAPFHPGLAMVFGQANHEAMATVFEKYRDKQPILTEDIIQVSDQYLANQLVKLIPEPVFTDSEKFLKGRGGNDPVLRDALKIFKDMKFMNIEDTLKILGMFETEEFSDKGYQFSEFAVKGKPTEEFLQNIAKRRDESRRIFEKWLGEEGYKKFGKPKDILAIEEDIMVVINGIPIYFIADLVTTKRVFDYKFTAASQIEKRRGQIPSDLQLWLYELVYGRPGELVLFTPPAKKVTAKTKPRNIPEFMGRRDKGQLVWSDADFVDLVESVPRCIEQGFFEKRGQSFLGGCGDCEAYTICNQSYKKSASLSINEIGKMTLKSEQHVKLDVKARRDQLIKEAEDGTYKLDMIEDE